MSQSFPISVADAQQGLLEYLGELSGCVVAYSGGVDSAVVAKAAQLALGERALAVTGVSASLAAGELDTAQRIAASIGIRHETLHTDELADVGYLKNEPTRCWHCKNELYSQIRRLAVQRGFAAIANGTNIDDLGDFRPGLQAAEEHGVVSPLVACGVNKQKVRELAQAWGLEVWDKPASPCLSSRVVYGLDITPERLARIDAAEAFLRELGFSSVRVRCHQDELARLEVDANEVARLAEPHQRTAIANRLREIGFRYVTVDLEGFRSGSFTQLVSVDQLTLSCSKD
ncbi:ATP-dependent sacrificial sulfur transferase LarE [Bythopirellula polymerisocia]|uniref:tRNA-specific 2-thiouridylase MnmA n=1 Tax=Bythopirellula polymerisocia TaxID=2528003 RepID=A0A5C6CQZ3_9BACT|nr:ATP-dependent sacrificial sulfur transferase LarE [Bythopirellula polymerisocia]TWU27343.1 tRNA-specific 2-thiouridylase MnmA [Bythopirellula polymerisocia]